MGTSKPKRACEVVVENESLDMNKHDVELYSTHRFLANPVKWLKNFFNPEKTNEHN